MHKLNDSLVMLLLAAFAAFAAFAASAAAAVPASSDAGEALDEVVVTATLRRAPLDRLAASATVIERESLRRLAPQHFADVLGLLPDLNWASGTNRPRYFQLRGIGETEQWQGAPNPSVGFLIDGMDFSGVSSIATLRDVEQIEVLRGPQGTLLGANALAGLINVSTRAAQRDFGLQADLRLGSANARSAGLTLGGAAGSASAWRVNLERQRSDGFTRNVQLGRDDTNGIDESTARLRWQWRPSDSLEVDLSTLWVDQDNGYDAFTLDNSRQSRADQPGRDAQRASGAALRLQWRLPSGLRLQSLSSVTRSDSDYGYDGDWGASPDYDFTQRFLRDRLSRSQDLRLSGERWVVGVYARDLREDGEQADRSAGVLLRAPLRSDYESLNLAAYGQVEVPLTERLSASLGLRNEQREAEYRDSDGTDDSPADRMLGGNASLRLALSDRTHLYFAVARGYKAGGFNIGSQVPAARRRFGPEYLDSAELGLRFTAADRRLAVSATAFLMRRRAAQVSTSVQLDPGDPLSFLYLTDNAARGRNDGMEWSVRWQPAPGWQVESGGALLRSRYAGLRAIARDLEGRAQTHAPARQFNAAFEYQHASGAFVRVDAHHTGSFYFGDSHDRRSRPYTLASMRVGLERERWTAAIWAQNLFDTAWTQRGYFFGNEPPDFPDRLYVQPGDPRQFGVSLTWRAP